MPPSSCRRLPLLLQLQPPRLLLRLLLRCRRAICSCWSTCCCWLGCAALCILLLLLLPGRGSSHIHLHPGIAPRCARGGAAARGCMCAAIGGGCGCCGQACCEVLQLLAQLLQLLQVGGMHTSGVAVSRSVGGKMQLQAVGCPISVHPSAHLLFCTCKHRCPQLDYRPPTITTGCTHTQHK